MSDGFAIDVATARRKPCRYCGIPMSGRKSTHWRAPTRDHVVPQSRGGGGGPIFYCCLACNQDKGSLSLGEWLRSLIFCGDPRVDRVRDALFEFEDRQRQLRENVERYRGQPMPAAAIAIAMNANGCFDQETLEAWGVPWPAPKGWKKALMARGLPFRLADDEGEAPL